MSSNTNSSSGQPGYVEQATNLLNSAAATVSSYLPTSVTGVDPNQATDTKGAYGVGGHPGSHGGVGDLGTEGTTDVVRLPDERADSGPLQGAAGAAYASGAVGFGGPTSSDDTATETFATPNTTVLSDSTTSGATTNQSSGTGLEGKFEGLHKIHPGTSGTVAGGVDPATYGTSEQTMGQATNDN